MFGLAIVRDFNYTRVIMTRLHLGELEQLLLMTLVQVGPKASGADVRQFIEDRTGRVLSPGAVFTAMQRMDRRGFVVSRFGAPTPQRGGKRKKLYSIRPAGSEALAEMQGALANLAGRPKPAVSR